MTSGLAIALSQGIGEHSLGRPGTAIRVLLLFTFVRPQRSSASSWPPAHASESSGMNPPRPPFAGRIALRATIIAAASIPVTLGFRFWIHPLLHAVRLPGLIALVAVPVWLITAAAQLAWRRLH